MKGYFIRSTRVSPSVYFNPDKKLLDIRGKSVPENPRAFYSHVFKSLDDYLVSDYSELVINLAFEHFNTSTSKCVFMMLKKAEKLIDTGKKVSINWYYESEDEDMLETGEDLDSIFKTNMMLIEIERINPLGEAKKEVDEDYSFAS